MRNSYLFQKRFNVYSCKAHDIDSGGTRVAGRREHDDMPLPHMVVEGQSQVYSSFGEHYNDK